VNESLFIIIIIIIIIIIFVIIIGNTALLEPQPSLEDSARLHPVFTSFDSSTIIFYGARSLALRPTANLEDQVSVFMSPSDSGPVIPPGTWFPFHRLLRLAGQSQSQSQVATDGQSWCRAPSGAHDQKLITV
jgi:hypothetical protein